LSVFRGNFTVPGNDIHKNKDVFHFPLDDVEGNWTITHFISLDNLTTVRIAPWPTSSAEEFTSFTSQLATATVPQMG
jgi:hypothetical protein